MTIETYPLGFLQTNCYFIKSGGEAIVIDPAVNDRKLFDYFIDSAKIKYIIMTHNHFDHVQGVDLLKKSSGAQTVISDVDNNNLANAEKADITVKDGDELVFGDEKIEILETPGHTSGSVCLLVGDSMFSGDTLFFETIGRTENRKDMINSLLKLIKLDKDYIVYPGHGETTTLLYEKQNNVYMKHVQDGKGFI